MSRFEEYAERSGFIRTQFDDIPSECLNFDFPGICRRSRFPATKIFRGLHGELNVALEERLEVVHHPTLYFLHMKATNLYFCLTADDNLRVIQYCDGFIMEDIWIPSEIFPEFDC
jgi:hypothetical protein